MFVALLLVQLALYGCLGSLLIGSFLLLVSRIVSRGEKDKEMASFASCFNIFGAGAFAFACAILLVLAIIAALVWGHS